MVKSIDSKEIFPLRLSAKLSDRSASANNYWSILKSTINGKKISLIFLLRENLSLNFLKS